MRITGETKIFIGIILATIVIIFGGILFFSKPSPAYTRGEMMPEGTMTDGPKDARVYLVEFSDFQCPSCIVAKPYVDEVRKDYKDKLLFAYRHFPLKQHQFGALSALSAQAAGEQGKFWEMYDFLFAAKGDLSEEKIKEGAKGAGLDMKKYEEDIKSDKIKNMVEKDVSDGEKFGVSGTPTFFLNGQQLELGNFSELKKAVDAAMAK